MQTLRKVTFGEMAEIADTPSPTIHGWIDRGTVAFEKPKGWARFDVPSIMRIAGYAQALRLLENPHLAIQTANFLSDSYANFCLPGFVLRRRGELEGNYLIFRSRRVQSLSGGEDVSLWREKWCKDQSEFLHALGEYTADASQFAGAAAFVCVDLGTIASWIMDRVFDLQGIEGDQALAGELQK